MADTEVNQLTNEHAALDEDAVFYAENKSGSIFSSGKIKWSTLKSLVQTFLSGSLVTNGDSHNHIGGDGAQIDHATLSNIGSLTHVDIDALLKANATEKSVSSGVLTVDASHHKVQPESGTADDVDTISGMADGTLLVLTVADDGTDTLTYKHGTGNISCFGGNDIAHISGVLTAYRDGATVYLAGGGGGGVSGSSDGWIDFSADTWTYASATTVTITGDATDRYSAGDPVRYKQGGAYKYGYIVDIAFSTNTTLTIYGGSDYSISNGAITDNDISKSTNPVGHPFWFNWDGSPANLTVGNGTLTSQFAVIGKEVVAVVEFNLGTTSSISGNVSFTPPLTIGTSTTGVAYVEEGGVGGYVGVTLATGTFIYINILSTSGSYGGYSPFSSTVPFTWGATDSFKFIISYPLG